MVCWMGNRTVIVKERRGFPEESGSYRYSYDALQRLTDVEKMKTYCAVISMILSEIEQKW